MKGTLSILLVILLTTTIVFSQENATVGKLLTGHRGSVDAVAYSGDGETLVTLGADKIIIVRDPQTGDEKSRVNVGGKDGHRNAITSLSINQDGTQIITASNDRTIRRWNVASGKQEQVRFIPDKIPATSFINQQPLVLAGSDRGDIILWNLDEEKPKKILRGHTRDILAFATRNNAPQFAAASEDKLVSIWSVDDDKAKIVFGEHRGKVTAIAFQPRSNRIASGGSDKAIYYWALDGKTGKVVRKFTGHNSEITSLKFSPNEREEVKTLLSTSRDKTLIQWRIDNGEVIAKFDKMGSPIVAAAYIPDFTRVVLLGNDGKAKLFNDDELDLLLPLPPFPKPPTSKYDSLEKLAVNKRLSNQDPPPNTIIFSPNGQLLLTSDGTNEAAVRNIETGEAYFNVKCGSKIISIVFAPDGKTFVTGEESGAFTIWQVADGKRLNRFVSHTVAVTALAFSPRGDYLITGDIAGHALLWNTATGKNLTVYERHKTAINSIAIRPDQSQVVTASDKQIGVWQSDGTLIKMLDKHSDEVTTVRYQPDGKTFISGSKDKTAIVWDAKTYEPIKKFDGFNNTVTAIDFTSDSKKVVIGSQEGRAVIFETETWTPKSVLIQLPERQPETRKNKRIPPLFPEPIKTLDINPANNKIVTNAEKEIIIWDMK